MVLFRHPSEYRLIKGPDGKLLRLYPEYTGDLPEGFEEMDHYEEYGRKYPAYRPDGRLVSELMALKRFAR